ncbi:MAG: hypothetical protein QGI86_01240 [Candidatus Poribacteria bacterium]|nr:hypothetical protein [Candidatus Poribacteria bacterium]
MLAHQLLNQSWGAIHQATDGRRPLFFCTCARLINWNDCAMEETLLQINIIGDLFQPRFPTPFLAPSGVAPIDTVPVAKGRKQVGPRLPNRCNPPHSFNQQSVVPAGLARVTLLAW